MVTRSTPAPTPQSPASPAEPYDGYGGVEPEEDSYATDPDPYEGDDITDFDDIIEGLPPAETAEDAIDAAANAVSPKKKPLITAFLNFLGRIMVTLLGLSWSCFFFYTSFDMWTGSGPFVVTIFISAYYTVCGFAFFSLSLYSLFSDSPPNRSGSMSPW